MMSLKMVLATALVFSVSASARAETTASKQTEAVAGLEDTKRRARKRLFDASGVVSCAQEKGEALGACKAGVARGADKAATVVVRFPNGFSRHLYFEAGAFVSANSTMSGVGTDTDWSLENGTHVIRVDGQRYEVPGTLIDGD